MPLFEYDVIDSQGKDIRGVLNGSTQNDVYESLKKQGFRVKGIRLQSGSQSSPPHINPPIVSAPTSSAPAIRKPIKAPSQIVPSVIKTKRGSDKANFFIFSQLASFAKSGQNIGDAFHKVGLSQSRTDYREALVSAGEAAQRGEGAWTVLARYPYLFPPHIPGLVRAGEMGGFLPEALDAISEQSGESHRFKRWFVVSYWMWASTLASLPVGILFIRTLLETWSSLDREAGVQSIPSLMTQKMGDDLLWPVGPVTLGIIGALMLFRQYWRSLKNMESRHAQVLKVPSIGRRAQQESLAMFMWILSRLTRAGVSPRSSMELAIDVMPNRHLVRRLRQRSIQMHEGTKLSEALTGADLIPPEYCHLLATGEAVGDAPAQLDRISAVARDEYKIQEGKSKVQIGCWTVLAWVVGTGLIGILIGIFYRNIVQKINEDVQNTINVIIPLGIENLLK